MFLQSFLTPLHVAAEKAHNDVIEIVVKHEAKVWTAFLINGHTSVYSKKK